ncbi:hypothetical protein JX265_005687 [Neoarthrinium moseri]|uniref:Apple domain-containing protein n=1 Tax=Neoarthrinium moseri TaxID=1658444 RepID=A0A9P9WN02_9PEZI|nr:uncharacterized protein JN550_008427 [Neoarthrinium moseri]KAI1848686.1 hypothetical protein JX266_005545 [Neoarthrinium moseri]KAI1865379.1 hypothetical protein JN550_008427 [Neoarthrinium moseri]KAI1871701.1 hypothetical protein JX265_005687 [Neoarthrinium moseri]
MKSHTILSLLLASASTHVAVAQNVSPEEFCKQAGPNYVPAYEPDGSFDGNCKIQDGKICLGTEYKAPKGGSLCCEGGSVMAIDSATKDADCCPPGKIYSKRACINPPPPPVPQITCPGSNGQWVTKNGVRFQVWCQRNIIEYTDPLDWSGKFSAVMNMNKRGSATFQDCLDACAADKKCQGTNWWYGKGMCGLNNKQQGGSWFSRGGDYKNPPDVAWMDRRVIAAVAVPKR